MTERRPLVIIDGVIQELPIGDTLPTLAAIGHRYWRTRVITNYGHVSACDIPEIEMRETVGGADECTGGTPIAGGGFTGGVLSRVFDDDVTNSYSPGGVSGYVGYDFGAGNEKAIVEVAFTMHSNPNQTSTIKTFALEYSDDGSIWYDSGNGVMTVYGWLPLAERVFPEPVAPVGFHRMWRVFCEVNNGGSSFNVLDDVQFKDTAGGSDQCGVLTATIGGATGRAIGSNGGGTDQCWKCFDSDVSGADPYFMTGTTNTYVGYIFPTPVRVQEIIAQCYSNTGRAPNIIRIEYCDDDAVTWVSQKRITGLTWTANEAKTLAAV